MARHKANLWFIPIRVHTQREKIIMEGKTIKDAISILKKSESYYRNFNKLNPKEQEKSISKLTGFPAVFELEDDFYENMFKHYNKRLPEEIPACAYRKWNKRWGEYFCKGFEPKEVSSPNRFCIIHGGHFKFDLPQDCPYLKQESKYIQFTE